MGIRNVATEYDRRIIFCYTNISLWRGDRVVDGNGLENRRGATYREFESRPLRQGELRPFGSFFFFLARTVGFSCRVMASYIGRGLARNRDVIMRIEAISLGSSLYEPGQTLAEPGNILAPSPEPGPVVSAK
jgi:hypothetical protein